MQTMPWTGPKVEESKAKARRFLQDNSLSLVMFGLFFVVTIIGQSLAGQRVYSEEQLQHGGQAVSYLEYIRTAHFGEATFENWESEFLQMAAYVVLTIWLRQRGSSESKQVEGDDPVDEDPSKHTKDRDAPAPVRRGGLALALYRNSLSIAFFVLFLLSWWLHALTGASEYNSEQLEHGAQAVSTLGYVTRSQFWFESLQNWQSEFMAVGAIVLLSVWLRQQGSPESKPVHAPHRETGTG